MDYNIYMDSVALDVNEIVEKGDYFLTLDEHAKAKEYYDEAARLDPDHPGPYVGTALIALAANNKEDAEAGFKVALMLDKTNSKAYAGLGSIKQAELKYELAFDYYLKALKCDPDNFPAMLGLFQTSMQMGTFSKVIKYLEYYLTKNPGDSSVSFCLANLYMKEAQLEKARLLLEPIVSNTDNRQATVLLEEVENMIAQTKAKVA